MKYLLYECIHVVISVCQIGYVCCKSSHDDYPYCSIELYCPDFCSFDVIRGRDSIVGKLCIIKSFAFFILTKMSVCLMDCKVSAVNIQDHIHSTKTNSD